MIFSDLATRPAVVAPAAVPQSESLPTRDRFWQRVSTLHRMTWVCLLLACLGASWFSYQYFLVPQPKSFAPDWQGAQWVHAADGNAPVAYFRYVTSLDALPDGAFVTIAASQVFRLYLNGTFVGSNASDFSQGNSLQAYIYDVDSLLRLGTNAIAVQVANQDQQTPSVRVSFGSVLGKSVYYTGTGDGWQATSQPTLAYPHFTYGTASQVLTLWTRSTFDSSSWLPVQKTASPPISPMLMVNPLLYEQPISTRWMSVGIGHDAYFVRQVSLPLGTSGAWLRIIATGIASVFVNGQLLMVWDGQPLVSSQSQNVAYYLSDKEPVIQYRSGLVLGEYDISPYLHPGVNTLAVHVSAPGVSAAQVGLDNVKAAMSLDMLVTDFQDHSAWLASNMGWHASPQPADGWVQASQGTLTWPVPISIGQPGASRTAYLLGSDTSRNKQFIPFSLLCEVILFTIGIVLGLWLFMSLFLMRRYYRSRRNALETLSLAYLPALACEGILLGLSREPQIPDPFPYTWAWGLVLIMLVGVGYVLLWLNARAAQKQRFTAISNFAKVSYFSAAIASLGWRLLKLGAFLDKQEVLASLRDRILAWLRVHWALVPIILVAIPLILYNLAYEPYWQDELTSYYAAKGILAHGLPVLVSGFLYTKGELYSYMLAFSMLIFGDQVSTLRMISALEYLVSLPLLYVIGCYFFERRIALLATAMLALSPIALEWGRQVRMYEQAQVLTILTVYLFYRALQERQRVRLVYLAVACLLLDYLSHEEIFIILPAIVLWVLVASRDETHRAFAVLYQKHWWFAGAIGAGVISLQLLIAHFSHPAALGTDQSQLPFILLNTNGIPFYFKLLFFPSAVFTGNHGKLPWITLNSLLAIAGCIVAMYSKDARAKYCTWCLLVSLLTLVLLFAPQSDRYIYAILPLYYFMGAYAMLMGLRALWRFARSRIALQQPEQTSMLALGGFLSKPMKVMSAFTVSLVCACVLIVPILPLSNYSLFIARQAGFPYHRYYTDYDVAGQYMQSHWRKGDIVISSFPAISALYYVGRVDYFLSIDDSLYLFERGDGSITDTPTGSTPLLSQDDLRTVLATHARIWVILSKGLNQSGVQSRFNFPPDFHLVYEGYASAIYLRGS